MLTMNISYSKKKRPPYINFRMRKLIKAFLIESANADSQKIAEGIEQIVCENYWIKDKRKDCINVNINKAA